MFAYADKENKSLEDQEPIFKKEHDKIGIKSIALK